MYKHTLTPLDKFLRPYISEAVIRVAIGIENVHKILTFNCHKIMVQHTKSKYSKIWFFSGKLEYSKTHA